MSGWIDELKVGDKVIIGSRGAGGNEYVSTVVDLTKTLIKVGEKEQKFSRKFGTTPGKGYGGSILEEATPEAVDRIRHRNLAYKLKRFDWLSVSLDTLRKVCDVLPK